jgi:toxin ParE1/3/4
MSDRSRAVAFAQRALNDLDDIAAYGLKVWGSARADDYLRQIENSIANLISYPDLGAARDDLAPGVRTVPVGQHRIFYIAAADEILMVRIAHHHADIRL